MKLKLNKIVEVLIKMKDDDFYFKNYAPQIIESYTDEFAIGFAEWCDDNYFRMGNTSFWAESMDWDNDNKFTTKELLEIYKKQKKL